MDKLTENYFLELGISVSFLMEGNPCIHINNSHLVKNRKAREKVIDLILASDEFKNLQRSGYTRYKKSMLGEWAGHNFLYSIGYKRNNTASVDIDNNEPFWRKVIYAIIDLLMR